jgi:transcriptional regulator with XRE-family HTH domain
VISKEVVPLKRKSVVATEPNSEQFAARRRLGTELRSLRHQALRSGQHIAAALGWSQSKISRIEHARTLTSINDLRALINELHPPTPLRKQLLLLAEQATPTRSNRHNPSGTDRTHRRQDLITLERASCAIRHYQPMQIPGYMQITQYARRVIDMAGSTDIDRDVELQTARRQTMTGLHAPSYSIILLETALLWRPGPPSMMAQQLELVTELAGLPNVDLRVLRLAGPHATYLHSPCMIFDFDDSDQREALLATAIQDVRVTDQAGLDQLSRRLDRLFSSALAPEESLTLIRAIAKSYTAFKQTNR